MKTVIILMMFLFIGMFFIISENNLALKNSGNFGKAINLYSAWMSQIFGNSRDLTGYVVKMNWLPDSNKSGK